MWNYGPNIHHTIVAKTKNAVGIAFNVRSPAGDVMATGLFVAAFV